MGVGGFYDPLNLKFKDFKSSLRFFFFSLSKALCDVFFCLVMQFFSRDAVRIKRRKRKKKPKIPYSLSSSVFWFKNEAI